MIDQTRFDIHSAATKAESLAYNLKNAGGLASMMYEALDREIDGTIEGQAFLALVNLLDKLTEDCESLSGNLYALHRGMAAETAIGKAPAAGPRERERGTQPNPRQ